MGTIAHGMMYLNCQRHQYFFALHIDEEGGQAGFLVALRHVIDVRDGIRPIAERTGLIRETLHRALSANGNPHSRQELSTEVW